MVLGIINVLNFSQFHCIVGYLVCILLSEVPLKRENMFELSYIRVTKSSCEAFTESKDK
jgi:hypothetical protein